MQRDTRSPLDSIFGHLSSAEQQEAIDLIDYLAEHGGRQDSRVPEGSLTAVLMKATPRVREAMALLAESLDVPRMQPFARKMELGDKAAALGFDPATLESTKGRLDQETVTAGLQDRMGTDRDLPQEPLSRRDVIAAALDQYGGE